jgi:hypothetical protein
MNRMVWKVGAIGLLSSACGVQQLDAGPSGEPAPAAFDAGEAAREKALWPYGAPSNSFDRPCTLPAPPELAGTWQGQLHSYAFPTGSSAIRIDITGSYEEADGLCGKVTFGTGSPPPVATDPAADPPELVFQSGALPPGPPSVAPFTLPLEGFPYEFYQPGTRHVLTTVGNDGGMPVLADAGVSSGTIAVDGDRVTFAISMRQPLKSWCNIQLSYFLGNTDGRYQLADPPMMNCISEDSIDDGPGSIECSALSGVTFRGVSCAQATYCTLHACDCAFASLYNKSPPHGCTVNVSGDGQFNLTLNGSALAGTVSFGAGTALHRLDVTRIP